MTFEEWRDANYPWVKMSPENGWLKEAWQDSRKEALRHAAEVCREQESEPWYGKRGKWAEGFRDCKCMCADAIEREAKN